MVFQNDILAGSSASGTSTAVHTIDQSIRFNSSDSTYMQRTHGAGGNTDKWTVSFWIKKGDHSLSAPQFVFGSGANTSNTFDLYFESSPVDTLAIQDYASAYNVQLKTTQLFRDPSAWYHIVYVYDSGNAVSTERARLYVNGQRVTDFGTETYPSQNQDSIVGTNVNIGFGRYISNGSNYFNGYLAEMHYVNGSALDPSSFGEYNSSNIWIPKEYSGSYGTGGFYIKGEDSSDLGNDSSGNGNDLTTSGLASHDQVADSPTNNFAVANPLDSSYYMGSETFSEGNLQMTLGSSVGGLATMGITSGKWYAEFEVHSDASGTTYFIIGIYGDQPTSTQHFVGYTSNSYGYYALNGNSYTNFTSSSYGNSYTVGDVVGVAVDLDNNKLYFSKNGTFQNSGDPTSGASGTGAISINPVSSTGLGAYFIASSSASSTPSGHTINYNFGQDGTFAGNVTAGGNSDGNGIGNFKYSVPSGYLALCTKNLGS